MAIEISAAISSLTAAIGLMKGAIDARDEGKAKEAIMEISNRLFAIHTQANELLSENRELRNKVEHLEHEAIDRIRYVLREVEPGKFALLFEPADEDQTAAHYICQACFGIGKKVVLQLQQSVSIGCTLACPCDTRHDIQVRSIESVTQLLENRTG